MTSPKAQELEELREDLAYELSTLGHFDDGDALRRLAEFEAAVGEKAAQAIEARRGTAAHQHTTVEETWGLDEAARIAREVTGGGR